MMCFEMHQIVPVSSLMYKVHHGMEVNFYTQLRVGGALEFSFMASHLK